MSDIKDNLRRLVLSLSEDEVHAVLAIVQSSRVEETGDVTCGDGSSFVPQKSRQLYPH